MLNIFAETFRIVAREHRPGRPDALRPQPRIVQRRADEWFWQGRAWRAPLEV